MRRLWWPGVSCYLVRGERGSILIDTGLAGMGPLVERAVRGFGVRAILLTHHHIDHAGNAAYLREALRAPVAAHPVDREHIEAGGGPRPGGFGKLGRLMSAGVAVSELVYHQPPSAVDIELREGDSLEEFGVEARVLHVPGHTQGSISAMTATGALVAGDSVVNVVRPGVSFIGEDEEKARRSFKRVMGLGAGRIYPGHGEPFGGGGE